MRKEGEPVLGEYERSLLVVGRFDTVRGFSFLRSSAPPLRRSSIQTPSTLDKNTICARVSC